MVVACSMVGERPAEGGGVSVLVTFLVADVVVSAVSDTDSAVVGNGDGEWFR